MSRLFVAVFPPPAVLDLLDALPRTPSTGVRFPPRAQLHVTLRFLGDTDEDAAIDALDTLRGSLAAPVEARLGPAVCRLTPDVVVVPVEGLDLLAASVHAATGTVVARPDPRPFRGHLTLARTRRSAPTSLEGARCQARFRVDSIALVRSELHPDGARHEAVRSVSLTTRS